MSNVLHNRFYVCILTLFSSFKIIVMIAMLHIFLITDVLRVKIDRFILSWLDLIIIIMVTSIMQIRMGLQMFMSLFSMALQVMRHFHTSYLGI
jgi:hypothetical protein